MPKYNVKISCLGHTFNVNNVEAINEEEASARALKMVKSKTTIASVQPVQFKGIDKDAFDHIMDMFGWKK